MGLMAGADERCSREDILAVPLPEATRTYRPVPNGLVLDMVEDEVTRVYGVSKDDMEVELAMSSDGQQMFGSLIVPEVYNERFQSALNIVFRNSYHKSITLAFGGGASCGVPTYRYSVPSRRCGSIPPTSLKILVTWCITLS